jgi:hypothetical protein
LLLSNGAQRALEVRGAYDLANLTTLLGIDFGIAKAALSVAPFSILQRCVARRSAKGVLRVTDIHASGAQSSAEKGKTDSPASAAQPSAKKGKTKDSAASAAQPSAKKGKEQTTNTLPEFIPLGADEPAPPPQKAAEGKRKGKRKAGAE